MTTPLIRQGEGPIAAYARREHERTAREQHIARISLATDAPIQPAGHRTPGDPWKLRGIPVVGVHGGIGGAIPGTRP